MRHEYMTIIISIVTIIISIVTAVPGLSVYSGHQSILIPPVELESNPALWLLAVSQLRVRDTFCSYSVMELCTKGLGLQTDALKVTVGTWEVHALHAQQNLHRTELLILPPPPIRLEAWTCPA